MIPKTHTPVSLELPEEMPFESWLKVGEQLGKAAGRVMWWLGDWWAYGEHHYGERAKLPFESEEFRWAFQTCRDAAWVARAITMSRRRDILPWGHHKEVAALEPPEQDELLTESIKKKWSQRDLRRAVRRLKANRIGRGMQEYPKGKYRVIYADPPWSYGNEQPAYHTEQADHYPLMPLQEIADLPVKEWATDDAVLFLWVTGPILAEALADVVPAWGFEYKAAFIWDKIKHNMGHYNSVRHELLLICVRGFCTPDEQKLFDSVQSIERSDKQGEKPEEFRKIIDTLYPNGPRIELFNRKKAKGWKRWGNEI